ncbi:substrate-binding domain-containing protein [Alkalihalobacillus macyae]|uniref:substrate-binding domain-containing protein n=1 Tax=Guptibacillus hwajinpoensis TaxID=208199 RepID=UPI00273B3432|nr:substrate-binding domain-containing protein [Alkalihalobacillus macyae]MDP4552647.1 substrate-binding domain-containing protein [Alkalihalobacillus macyae]
MTNIRKIAEMAQVSASTVSRVLNGYAYVSKEKEEAVWNAVNETNYRKNINAVHLSKGKTFLIGVVIPFTNHPYFGQLVEGISDLAIEHQYNLVLFQTNYHEKKEIEALNMLKHKQIDALIICSRTSPLKTIKEYLDYGQIVLCEDTKEDAVSSTFVDHYQAFTMALTHLHKKGHTQIGYCIGRRSGANSQNRELAYKDFIQRTNGRFQENHIFEDCLYFEDGEHVVNQITQMTNPPTALLVTSDQVAAGILVSCENSHLSVPDDLALIGFDNQPISKMMKITTIEMNLVEIGRNLFLQAMEEQVEMKKEIAVQLIERETV